MGYPPLEDLLPKSGYSVYKLIRMASKRATELADGKRKLIENPSLEKATTISLEEIQAGQVVLKDVADQFKPEPEQGKDEKKEEVLQEKES